MPIIYTYSELTAQTICNRNCNLPRDMSARTRSGRALCAYPRLNELRFSQVRYGLFVPARIDLRSK